MARKHNIYTLELLWYASGVPKTLPKDEIDAARAATKHARSVREYHRRRTERGSPQREADIQLALDRLRDAMAPLRTLIGQFPYGPQTDEAERNRQAVRKASNDIQAERRKLWKMQGNHR